MGAKMMHFEYEEQMQKIFKDDPVFNPVYNSDNRKEMGSANSRKKKKKEEKKHKSHLAALDIIKKLHEGTRKENYEFQSKLLNILGELVSAIKENE